MNPPPPSPTSPIPPLPAPIATSSPPSLIERALAEYAQCEEGIAKYDEHLFRIRSWNIALSALLLAGFFGINVEASKDSALRVTPSTAIVVYTLAAVGFWLLDSMHKSLQTTYIQNSRSLESFLNGSGTEYIGPSIALRFHRRSSRFFVETIKNLTDGSIIMFYLPPIVLFSSAVMLINRFPTFCWEVTATCEVRPARIAAVALFATILLALLTSWLWNRPPSDELDGWHVRYFLRPRSRMKRRAIIQLRKALNVQEDILIGPFRADGQKADTYVFVDSLHVYRDKQYQRMRERALTGLPGRKVKVVPWAGDGRRSVIEDDAVTMLLATIPSPSQPS